MARYMPYCTTVFVEYKGFGGRWEWGLYSPKTF